MLNEYLDWPEVGQVLQLERVRIIGEKKEVEVTDGITSLTRQEANAERLLELVRGHWGIENSLLHVKDVTLGEDRCRVGKGNGPEVMAALRNVAVHLLDQSQRKGEMASKASATRDFTARPFEPAALVTS